MRAMGSEKKAKAEPGLREQKKRETERLLADTGVRLFLAQGYHETTLDQIAQEASISRRTIFSYFPSKEDILVAASASKWDDLLHEIATAPRDQTPLELVCGALLKRMASRSHKDMLALHRLMSISATLRSRYHSGFAEREQSVYETLADIWPEPERQWELRLVSMTAIGAFRLAVQTWTENPEKSSLHALTQRSFDGLRELLQGNVDAKD